MENFVFENPTRLIFGKNTIPKIGEEIKKAKIKKVLFLAGRGSIKRNRVYQKVVRSLQENKISWVEVWGVKPNPVLSKVREGIKTARREKVQAVLAVGGGSVIDSGKAICAGVYLKDIWQAFEGKVKIERALPLFVVLTLSATASEMNQWAVLTNEEEKKKFGLGSRHFYPRVSIVDPTAQYSLPWEQVVNGAIDGISHIMENYFLGKGEEASLAYNESLILSIIEAVDKIQENPRDYQARANLCWCITLAHNGFAGAGLSGGDWSAHRIEHSISALYPRVAHGKGLAVVFPAWLLYMQRYNPKTFLRFARNVWRAKSVEGAVKKMRRKYKSWGAPVRLRELGIREKDIPALVENAMLFPSLGVLKRLNKKDVREILKLAL